MVNMLDEFLFMKKDDLGYFVYKATFIKERNRYSVINLGKENPQKRLYTYMYVYNSIMNKKWIVQTTRGEKI